MMKSELAQTDPELHELIKEEQSRQRRCLELIASENFTSSSVMECLGSCLTNKYAEGQPGKRYYGGTEVVDKIENLCIERALKIFATGSQEGKWGVNVQPYSGSPANFAVYTACLKPHDRIMGLDLPSGGHLTHGFYTTDKKTGKRKDISATSVYFTSMPYSVDPSTGLLDYESIAALASTFKPSMLICGGSAYPREWNYSKFRKIADDNGCLLMCDMAHISGLVAVGEANSPFEFCDIVTTTTHKSLRGPRAGLIFYRKDSRGFENSINWAVFPALQGGPHEHQIAAVATQLSEVMKPVFKEYIRQVLRNCNSLAEELIRRGYKLSTNGTDNHLLLWDLRPIGLTGSKLEKLCDRCDITLNKNAICGDKSALSPGGVRIGTPALTTRGFKECDFVKVAEFLDRAVKIALAIQKKRGKALTSFIAELDLEADEIKTLRRDVNSFAESFPMPGINL